MSPTEKHATVSECSCCGSLDVAENATCCGERMETLERTAVFEEPELEQVARQVFGMAPNELTVCKALVAEDSVTISDLAGRLPYDRSTVSRHLDHLVELGVAEKESKGIAGGGRENVYSTVSEQEIRRQFVLNLYGWTEEAVRLTEELSERKIEAMVEEAPVAANGGGGGVGGTTDGDAERDDGDSGRVGSSLLRRLFGRD
jgi:predicted transcriptional regulator